MTEGRQFVTLVVPTHNRHAFLPRIADYHRAGPLDVLVVDSTDQPYAGPVPLDGIGYRHVPGQSFSAKIREVLASLDVPFVVLGGDDDFVVPGAVLRGAEVLRDDPAVTTVQGRRLGFWCHRRAVEVSPYPANQESSLLGATPLERTRALLSAAGYRDLFYAVHRTGELLDALEDCEKIARALYLQELLSGVHAMALGEHRHLDQLFCMRQSMLAGGTYTEASIGSIIYESTLPEELATFYDLCIGYVEQSTDAGDADAGSLAPVVTELLSAELDRQAGGRQVWQRRARGRQLLERLGLFDPRVRHLRRHIRELLGNTTRRRMVAPYGRGLPPSVTRLALSPGDTDELARAMSIVSRYPQTHVG